jgi:chemotaxis protein MotB
MAKNELPPVIRRIKKVQGGGHHGGAWKVAFADFATAMMAFFLLMWLVAATTKEQRGGIAEYFNNPSLSHGRANAPAVGANGPGGASTSMIKLGANMKVPRENSDIADGKSLAAAAAPDLDNPEEIKKKAKKLEKKRLESLMAELNAAIEASQALEPFKDQLLLDITPAGLRIQIVDKQNRPMFDLGGASPKNYSVAILKELAKFIQEVPNRISISGHTDSTPYSTQNGYTNWELSADRANAARRALVAGGLSDEKVALVVGLSSSVLFDKTNPQAPSNRRISIIVMTKAAEEAATGEQAREYSGGSLNPTDDETETPPSEEPATAPAPEAAATHEAVPAATSTPAAAAKPPTTATPAPAPAAPAAAAPHAK